MTTSLARRAQQVAALATMVGLLSTQAACYNTYFIEKDQLRKLESDVEQPEVVEVYADCPTRAAQPAGSESEESARSRYRVLEGTEWAQADTGAAADGQAPAAPSEEGEVATDAGPSTPPEFQGCTQVPISTTNSVKVVTEGGEELRVTPFNFIMSDSQLVSPEYDLLLPLNDVAGAEVEQFSTWKTVATIAGVTAVSVGTFVGLSLLADESQGFEQ